MIIEPKHFRTTKGEQPRFGKPKEPRFRGLVRYMLKGEGKERCSWYMAGNLEGFERQDDSESAIRVVEAYQRRNTRGKKDKTYHMVISLHPNDRSLTSEELKDVVHRAVDAIGYSEHQFIAVRHSDQEHEHVHVAVNKVHPTTLKIHHPWNDIESFKTLATALEVELDLHRIDRSPGRQRTAQSYQARGFEASRGEKSFSRWAADTVAAGIDLSAISDWPALHDRLAEHGVRLVLRGNGLALVDATRPNLACKASALGRHWSKMRLCERFGDFVPGPSAERVAAAQRTPYRAEPLTALRDDGLWQEYQAELATARRLRKEARDRANERVDRLYEARRTRSKLGHHLIQALPISGRDKATHYKLLSMERELTRSTTRKKAQRLRTPAPIPHPGTWKEFLATRAAQGDRRAVRRLARASRGPRIEALGSSPTLPRGPRTSRGSVVHRVDGGVRIRESYGSLELLGEVTDDGIRALVAVALDRFGDRELRLRGSREEQAWLGAVIEEQGLRVGAERGW